VLQPTHIHADYGISHTFYDVFPIDFWLIGTFLHAEFKEDHLDAFTAVYLLILVDRQQLSTLIRFFTYGASFRSMFRNIMQDSAL
jgi:hypothetical protein